MWARFWWAQVCDFLNAEKRQRAAELRREEKLVNSRHLLFYDGQCGFCDRIVQFVLKRDKKHIFLFAPLQGKTAENVPINFPEKFKSVDSLIFIENYQRPDQKIYVLGKGALRIFWLLGFPWNLIGWINFLPSFLYDWSYRLVARNRHSLFKQDVCIIPDKITKDRFLP